MNDISSQTQDAGRGPNVDELLQDLGRMLEVTPSPEFGARVLARVQHPTRESLLWSWRWGFAAGALLTVVVLTVVTRVNSKSSAAQRSEAQLIQTVALPTVEAVRTAPAMSGPVEQRPVQQRQPMTIVAAAERQGLRNPQVLIAPDQAAAVRTLLDRFARGNVASTVANKDTAEPAPQDLVIDELAPIPLIVISPLDAPPNTGGAGSKK